MSKADDAAATPQAGAESPAGVGAPETAAGAAPDVQPQSEPEAATPETQRDAQPEAQPEPGATRTEQRVEIERTVRSGRILVVSIAIGAIVAAMITLMFPVAEGSDYTIRQVVGIMMVIGAAVGLAAGSALVLILGRVAKRHRGVGVAVQTDVQQ